MRIQHNITAMNSYRNYSTNNSSLAGNLEKLSSGYRINRAGDDAAGLAMSEKMRAQITGLAAAKKNATDGISLIQTAEGALTEVHDMLNRMVTLAEQSANGTYADEVDREQLQKEVEALQSEIDRIADSTNFNGLPLLDGSLGTGTGGKSVPTISGLDLSTATAVKYQGTVGLTAAGLTADLTNDAELRMTINYVDGNGEAKSTILKLTYKTDGTDGYLRTESGTEIATSTATGALTGEVIKAVVKAAAEDQQLSKTFKVTSDAVYSRVKLTALEGDGDVTVSTSYVNFTGTGIQASAATMTVTTVTAGYDAFDYIDFSSADSYVVGDTFVVDGEKFAFVNNKDEALKLGSGVNSIVLDNLNSSTVNATDVASMRDIIYLKTGFEATVGNSSASYGSLATPTETVMMFIPKTSSVGGGGLRLQIGDTADSFNMLTVSVADMHTQALGIGSIDISTQSGASAALDKIKAAVNQVSDVRGTLGALQNRLDHTINNIGVMTENIQNAESAIRDTDVAEEMMAYTKNNILNQSAQSMLAQANQLPQGVLQLLQG